MKAKVKKVVKKKGTKDAKIIKATKVINEALKDFPTEKKKELIQSIASKDLYKSHADKIAFQKILKKDILYKKTRNKCWKNSKITINLPITIDLNYNECKYLLNNPSYLLINHKINVKLKQKEYEALILKEFNEKLNFDSLDEEINSNIIKLSKKYDKSKNDILNMIHDDW